MVVVVSLAADKIILYIITLFIFKFTLAVPTPRSQDLTTIRPRNSESVTHTCLFFFLAMRGGNVWPWEILLHVSKVKSCSEFLVADWPRLHNRATFFSTPNSSGRSSPSGHRYADDLEGQNDEALDGLHAKVKILKDVSNL